MSIPSTAFASLVDLALFSPAEPPSQEAMGLLCKMTQPFVREFVDNAALERAGYAARPPCDPCYPNGCTARADLARMYAANAALCHLKTMCEPSAQRVHGAPRVTLGQILPFLSWMCEAPGVFQDLRERGLLETLADMLRSSDADKWFNAVGAVGVLAARHDSARGPLRALGAIRPLTQKLQVGPGLGFG